jgi:hypothetical protein
MTPSQRRYNSNRTKKYFHVSINVPFIIFLFKWRASLLLFFLALKQIFFLRIISLNKSEVETKFLPSNEAIEAKYVDLKSGKDSFVSLERFEEDFPPWAIFPCCVGFTA